MTDHNTRIFDLGLLCGLTVLGQSGKRGPKHFPNTAKAFLYFPPVLTSDSSLAPAWAHFQYLVQMILSSFLTRHAWPFFCWTASANEQTVTSSLQSQVLGEFKDAVKEGMVTTRAQDNTLPSGQIFGEGERKHKELSRKRGHDEKIENGAPDLPVATRKRMKKTPDATPVKRSDTSEIVINSKPATDKMPTHKRFDDEGKINMGASAAATDDGSVDEAIGPETNGATTTVQESEDSDDEAPETITASVGQNQARVSTVQALKAAKKYVLATIIYIYLYI